MARITSREVSQIWLLVLTAVGHSQTANPTNVLKIGGIFPAAQSVEETAVKLAVDTINSRDDILPNYQLEYTATHTASLAAFQSIQRVCMLLKEGVTTIIGPMSSTDVKASHPMCLGFAMPMITPSATDPMLNNRDAYKYLLRIMPADSMQSRALVDFIKYFRWDTVAILTDSTDYGINGLVEFQTKAAENKWRVMSVQQFEATANASDVDAREQLEQIKGTGSRVIILNCLAPHGLHVLEQAADQGMMQGGWVWIVTDGITGYTTFPDELSKPGNKRQYLKGLIGTRPVVDKGALKGTFKDLWSKADPDVYFGSGNNTPTWARAYYDSTLVYIHAMHQMLEVEGLNLTTVQMNCKQIPAQPWSQGPTVYDYLRKVSTDGVMKYLQFSNDGAPLNAAYDFVSLGDDGWKPIGEWSTQNGLSLANVSTIETLDETLLIDVRDYVGDLVNKSLRVVTIVDRPFVFKKGHPDNDSDCSHSGEDCFYGYAIDLLETLAEKLQFTYKIELVEDGKYGAYNPISGKWNGIVADLIANEGGDTKADMAVAAFTISSERQEVISFTKPYRDLQMGILIGTPSGESYDPWSFLIPLSYELWGLTLITAFVVGFAITLLDKLSPYGHHGRKAHIEHEHEHEAMDKNDDGTVDYWEMKEWQEEKHTMNLHNAILWSLASLFEQGGERHPKSWSARIAAGAWWIGALIIVQSYTANLAAFLTIKASGDDINSIEDLAEQASIQYGTISDTQIQTFFDTAKRSPYMNMAGKMREWNTYFDTTEQIVNHTVHMNGSFAMLYDYPGLQYFKGQNCRLKMVENGYGNMGYGLGLPKGSIYTEELTIQIYQLRESGYMDTLDEKWIKRTSLCDDDSDGGDISEDTVEIGMPSLWGVFWIIYVGFGISFVILIIEWFVSALMAVDPSDPEKPDTFCQSVRMRLGILKRDVMENWFPINFNKEETKRKELMVRPSASRLSIASLVVKSGRTASRFSSMTQMAAASTKEQ